MSPASPLISALARHGLELSSLDELRSPRLAGQLAEHVDLIVDHARAMPISIDYLAVLHALGEKWSGHIGVDYLVESFVMREPPVLQSSLQKVRWEAAAALERRFGPDDIERAFALLRISRAGRDRIPLLFWVSRYVECAPGVASSLVELLDDETIGPDVAHALVKKGRVAVADALEVAQYSPDLSDVVRARAAAVAGILATRA